MSPLSFSFRDRAGWLSGVLEAVTLARRIAGGARVGVDAGSALPGNCGDVYALGQLLMVLFKMCFHLPIEAVAVDGDAPSPMRIGTAGNGAAIDEVGVRRHVVVPTVPAVFCYEGGDVMSLFKRHVVPSGPHCELQGQIRRQEVLRPLLASSLLDHLKWLVLVNCFLHCW